MLQSMQNNISTFNQDFKKIFLKYFISYLIFYLSWCILTTTANRIQELESQLQYSIE